MTQTSRKDVRLLRSREELLAQFLQLLNWVCGSPSSESSVRLSYSLFDIDTPALFSDRGRTIGSLLVHAARRRSVELSLWVPKTAGDALARAARARNVTDPERLPNVKLSTTAQLRPSLALFRREDEVQALVGGYICGPGDWNDTEVVARSLLVRGPAARAFEDEWVRRAGGNPKGTAAPGNVSVVVGKAYAAAVAELASGAQRALYAENCPFWEDAATRGNVAKSLSRPPQGKSPPFQVTIVFPDGGGAHAAEADVCAELSALSHNCTGYKRADGTEVELKGAGQRRGQLNRLSDVAELCYETDTSNELRKSQVSFCLPVYLPVRRYEYHLGTRPQLRSSVLVVDDREVLIGWSDGDEKQRLGVRVRDKELAERVTNQLAAEPFALFPVTPAQLRTDLTAAPATGGRETELRDYASSSSSAYPYTIWKCARTPAGADGVLWVTVGRDGDDHVCAKHAFAGDVDVNSRAFPRYIELITVLITNTMSARMLKSVPAQMTLALKRAKDAQTQLQTLRGQLHVAQYDARVLEELLGEADDEYTWDLEDEGEDLEEEEGVLDEEDEDEPEGEEDHGGGEEVVAAGQPESLGKDEWKLVTSRNKTYAKRRRTLKVPVVELDQQGRPERRQDEDYTLVNSTFQWQTGGNVSLVRFILPKGLGRARAVFLRRRVVWEGRSYRLDLYDSGAADAAWGVAAGGERFAELKPFQESVVYSRQALLVPAVAGYEGRFGCYVVPETGFKLKLKNGLELIPYDGFGFMHGRRAASMGLIDAKGEVNQKLKRESASLARDAQPNTQMLQWLGESEDVVVELVETAIARLGASTEATSDTELYRTVTTGGFQVRFGIAVPAPGDGVVVPVEGIAAGTRVALHRSPADKPNWSSGVAVGPDDPARRFFATMTTVQYRLTSKTGQADSSFFKGLLGIIPAGLWPDGLDTDMVMCAGDRKVKSSWSVEDDVNKTKKPTAAEHLRVEGNLAISKIYQPGSIVGVPTRLMKEMSGDYDGDAVHVLVESDSPALFAGILRQPERENPKLPKTFTPASDGNKSSAERLAVASEADRLVGGWSVIADLLCATNPARLPDIAKEIGVKIGITDPDLTVDEMWRLVGLGIKAGTDLAKTTLRGLTLRNVALTADRLIEYRNKVARYLRRELGFDNPHRTGNKDSIAADVRNGREIGVVGGMRSGQYGLPARVMRAVNEYQRAKVKSRGLGALRPTVALGDLQARGRTSLTERAQALRGPNGGPRTPYLLIGECNQLLQRSRRANRAEDVDRWTLFAIEKVRPRQLVARPTDEIGQRVLAAWNEFGGGTLEPAERQRREPSGKAKAAPAAPTVKVAEIETAIDNGHDLEALVMLLNAPNLSATEHAALLRKAADFFASRRLDFAVRKSFVINVLMQRCGLGRDAELVRVVTDTFSDVQRQEMDAELAELAR